MDPDSFAMSSYQFVNSLASCYPQSQLAQQQQQQQQTHTQHPAGNQTAASDYFANPTYNPNLYSPHYANQNYLASQQQQQQQASAAAADMVDYTQLQPQRMMGLGGGAGGAAPGVTQGPNAPPGAGGHPAAASATNSCKYATGSESGTNPMATNTTSTGPIASPQDLTTARDLVSPKLSPNSAQENLKARSLSNTNNSNPTTNLSLHSPTGESDSESDSGAEENDGGAGGGGGSGRGGKKGSGSGPPTVYPWMKRVHLGQSE